MLSKKFVKRGSISTYLLIILTIGLAIILMDIYSPDVSVEKPSSANIVSSCCDSGDGDACKPQTGKDQTFTFRNKEYGLLKSNITLAEAVYHLEDTKEKFKEDPIIINTTQAYGIGECGRGRYDQVWGEGGCVPIPDDQLVYVCRKNCVPSTGGLFCGTHNISCYGTQKTEYDVYFRLSDYPTPSIPDVVKNCQKSVPQGAGLGKQQIVFKPHPAEKSLQLQTFSVSENIGSIPWLSPYCKPVIYLYPPKKTEVNVKIAPVGNLVLTIPPYNHRTGWSVTAYPNGEIYQGLERFDNLFYEAQTPDNLIDTETKEGYVVTYSNIKPKLEEILPQLGLNTNEEQEFINYWTKVLPKSPLYFIGIVPQTVLDNISPLKISPTPTTLIRVTLYFKPLDRMISVSSPTFRHSTREGFTVVEWGGLFKMDEKHPFTCLM